MIKIKHHGNFKNTEKFYKRVLRKDYMKILDSYGQQGVALLSQATPVDSGETASSWNYIIEEKKGIITIAWTNSNKVSDTCVVLLLIYGHALQNGAYIEGNQFVDPAIQPVMNSLAKKAWREVTR